MGDIISFLFFAAALYVLVRCGCFAPLTMRRLQEQPLPATTHAQQLDRQMGKH